MSECWIVEDTESQLPHHNYFKGIFISRIEFPNRNWALVHNGSRWSRIFNKWLAKVLKEDKNTNVLLKYHRVRLSSTHVLGKAGVATGFARFYLTREPICETIYPWFYPEDPWRSTSYIFKDYLFVEIPNHCALDALWIGTSLGWAPKDTPSVWPPCMLNGVSHRVLDPRNAIVLEKTNKFSLFAIPWYCELVSNRDQVERYCRHIFKWFKRRSSDPYFTEPCPGLIELRTEHEDLRIRDEWQWCGLDEEMDLKGAKPNIFYLTNWFDMDGTSSPDDWRKFFNLS